MRKKLLRMSVITFILAIIVFMITYFIFHYVTDNGITLIKQDEAGKPFVTGLFGQLGVLFLFSSVLSFIASIVFDDKK